MIYFNLNLFKSLLNGFSVMVGAKISVLDENLNSTDADGETNNPICAFVNSHIRERCSASDKMALEKAQSDGGAFYYKCHFGFIEIVIKNYVENNPFYIQIGPFLDLDFKRAVIKNIKELGRTQNSSSDQYIGYLKKIPEFTTEKFDAIVTSINAIVQHCKETKIIAVKEDIYEEEILPFLNENINKSLSITEICDSLNIPPKKFHLIIIKATGLTPKQFITKLKIDKAYEEIILTDKELQQIASDVGIDDYNYFIKLFKSIKGHTPKYYRKSYAK